MLEPMELILFRIIFFPQLFVYPKIISPAIQLVESVASCLIKIVEQVCHSSDMLEELCKHGLVQQATHLIDLNSRTTLCQPVYIVS